MFENEVLFLKVKFVTILFPDFERKEDALDQKLVNMTFCVDRFSVMKFDEDGSRDYYPNYETSQV